MSVESDTLAIRIASELIRCPSITGPGAETEAVSVLHDLFAAEPGVVCSVEAGVGDRPNFVATLTGTLPGPTLLLTGHLDVVPVNAADWTHPPFEPKIVDSELWGRGAVDMKGGVGALAAAFVNTARRGGPPSGQLVFAATADEEDEGRWGLPWLLNKGHLTPDYALVAEAAGLVGDFDRLPIACRGSAFATVRVVSGGGHASFGGLLGEHAVGVACRTQQALEAEFHPTPHSHWAFPDGPTVVAGELFRGGERLGELPRNAEFSVSCRLLPGADKQTFMNELDAFVTRRVPDTCTAEIAFATDVTPWSPGMSLSQADPFAQLALRAVQTAGYPEVQFGGFPAFSEGAFLAKAGVTTLPAIGPGALSRAHLPDERVAISALNASAQIYETIIGDVLTPGLPSSTASGGAPGGRQPAEGPA